MKHKHTIIVTKTHIDLSTGQIMIHQQDGTPHPPTHLANSVGNMIKHLSSRGVTHIRPHMSNEALTLSDFMWKLINFKRVLAR